ncbi:MAG: hypothetical protein LBU36_00995 [Clostridiales bacterium]|jgi:hypothetical protein|nr:hypothetical protein [Clostridiales bacterium]
MYLYKLFLSLFGDFSETEAYISLYAAAWAALAACLRAAVFIKYASESARFSSRAVTIARKSDLPPPKKGVFARSLKAYIKSCEKNPSRADAEAITERQLLSARFLFWGLDSAAGLIRSLELSWLFFAAAALFAARGQLIIWNFYIIIFAASRFCALIFDVGHARGRLKYAIAEYLEREIGQFYAADFDSALSRLRKELEESFKETFAEITRVLTENDRTRELQAAVGALAPVVAHIEENQSVLRESLDSYEKALNALAEGLGENIGALANYHAQSAENRLSAAIDKKINEMTETGSWLYEGVRSLLDEARLKK